MANAAAKQLGNIPRKPGSIRTPLEDEIRKNAALRTTILSTLTTGEFSSASTQLATLLEEGYVFAKPEDRPSDLPTILAAASEASRQAVLSQAATLHALPGITVAQRDTLNALVLRAILSDPAWAPSTTTVPGGVYVPTRGNKQATAPERTLTNTLTTVQATQLSGRITAAQMAGQVDTSNGAMTLDTLLVTLGLPTSVATSTVPGNPPSTTLPDRFEYTAGSFGIITAARSAWGAAPDADEWNERARTVDELRTASEQVKQTIQHMQAKERPTADGIAAFLTDPTRTTLPTIGRGSPLIPGYTAYNGLRKIRDGLFKMLTPAATPADRTRLVALFLGLASSSTLSDIGTHWKKTVEHGGSSEKEAAQYAQAIRGWTLRGLLRIVPDVDLSTSRTAFEHEERHRILSIIQDEKLDPAKDRARIAETILSEANAGMLKVIEATIRGGDSRRGGKLSDKLRGYVHRLRQDPKKRLIIAAGLAGGGLLTGSGLWWMGLGGIGLAIKGGLWAGLGMAGESGVDTLHRKYYEAGWGRKGNALARNLAFITRQGTLAKNGTSLNDMIQGAALSSEHGKRVHELFTANAAEDRKFVEDCLTKGGMGIELVIEKLLERQAKFLEQYRKALRTSRYLGWAKRTASYGLSSYLMG